MLRSAAFRSRRWPAIGVVAVLIASASASASAPTPSAGSPARREGRSPSVSGDGQYVAYVGPSSDQRGESVLLLDRELGVVTDLMPLPANIVPGRSEWPVLSRDGCTVTVLTELALDRYRDIEGGGRWDVYQRRLDHCGGSETWELVSGGDGAGLSAEATNDIDARTSPAVSGDGATVAYAYRTSETGSTSVAIVDMRAAVGATGRRRDVTAGSGTTILDPTLDAEGALLAATVASASGDSSRVLIWDLSDGAGDAPTTVPGSGSSSQPSLSGDGSALAFVADAPDAASGAPATTCTVRCPTQVYVYDVESGSAVLASRVFRGADDGEVVAGNADSSAPVLSETGDEVVFITRATNFFAVRHRSIGTAGDGDVVRVILSTETMRREVRDVDGIGPAPRVHGRPALSANGRVVATDMAPTAGGRQRMLSVVQANPQLAVGGLNLGTIPLGFTSAVATATITNRGPSSFSPALVSTSSPDASVVGGSCADPLADAIPPGSTCTVEVTFSPGAPGPREIVVRLEEDFFDGVVLEIGAIGVGGDVVLRAEPAQVAVPVTGVGTTTPPQAVFIQNVGEDSVRMEGLLVGGAHAAEFRVLVNDCAGERLRPGETCRVEVAFSPVGQGRRRAVLYLSSSGGGFAAVPLSGLGRYRPTVTVSPTLPARAEGDALMVRSGTRLTVSGAGFAPSATVVVSWADGFGRRVSVTTDETGAFRVRLAVLPGERPGERLLVASAAGHTAVLRLRVLPAPR